METLNIESERKVYLEHHSSNQEAKYEISGMNYDSYVIHIKLIGTENVGGTLISCTNVKNEVFFLHINGDYGDERQLLFTFFTSSEKEPFILIGPIMRYEQCQLHDVFVVVTDVKASMYINGNLIDEEWPLGSVACKERIEFNVSASVVETSVYGFNSRKSTDLHPEADEALALANMQYWRPGGYNTGVGDCMPFWHDGVFHLFYLFDRRGHKSKHGKGAHQWDHASSSDLVKWTQHIRTIPISEQWEGSICTGSVFFHNDLFYAYYSTRMSDGSTAKLSVSTSKDCRRFEKNPPLASMSDPYDGPSARDPMVFCDQDGMFHMLVTTSYKNFPFKRNSGCLAHLTSNDLQHWEQHEPFIIPGYAGQPECADYFHWNGWYYLVFSYHGIARYRMSRDEFGPWIKPDDDILNCPNVSVPKTAGFYGGRRISVGFLCDEKQYAGCTVFREIIQQPNGTLGTAFVDEMLPKAPSSPCHVVIPADGAEEKDGSINVQSPQGFCAVALTGLPVNKRISMHIRSGSGEFGLCLKSDSSYGSGTELRFVPSRRMACYQPYCADLSILSGHSSINYLDGLDEAFTLDIIINDTLIDACIDGKRTFIIRNEYCDTERVNLFAHWGSAVFEDIKVIPLS